MSLPRILLVAVICYWSQGVFALSVDEKLALVIEVYGLTPKACVDAGTLPLDSAKVDAGRVLFESTSLSGNRDIACRNCHLTRFDTADGLPIAVGVGGQGEGYARFRNGEGALVQRNAFSLRGRGNAAFTAFFWDGKVQVEDNGRVVTQFGDAIAGKFTTLLAVAAIMPLIERDEFIGTTTILSTNDVQHAIGDRLYYERYQAISNALRSRFLEPNTLDDRVAVDALRLANVDLDMLELADIGNLIAAFIQHDFPCRTSDWDRYLQGERNALTKRQKEGAVLFFGKGRCASCHAGSFFSDFEFHSIGTPQGYFGPHTRHRDIGRAAVTNRVGDLYKFRTPPLTDVEKTAPYGHNGAFTTLRDVVVHHFNPLAFYIAKKDYRDADYYRIGKLIASRDPVLATIDIALEDEVNCVLEFLGAL